MKKSVFIILVLFLFGMFHMNVFALDITMTPDGNVRSFEIPAPANTNEVVVKVYRADKGEEYVNGFLFFKAVEVDKTEGKFKFLVVIPDVLDNVSSSGDYVAKFVWNSKEKIDDYKFSYLTAKDAENFYLKLRNSSGSEIFGYMKKDATFLSNANAVGIDLNAYNSTYLTDKDKQEIADIFVNSINEETTDSELIKIFNKSINLKYLTVCPESERVKVASGLNFVYGTVSFNTFSDDEKIVISDFLAKQIYQKIFDGDVQFAKSVAILEVSTARKNKLTEVLNNHKNTIEIANNSKFQNYLLADEEKQLKVNEKFINLISNAGGINSTNEIITCFESAYNDVFVSYSSSKGNSGGGGKSGGFKPSSFTYMEPTVEETNALKITISDIKDVEWAVNEIEYCVRAGIINGYPDGTFRPNNTITREEFVTLLLKAMNSFEDGHKSDFEDVEANSWYQKYVACAKHFGIIKGISDKKFGTGLTITREDMSVIIANALKFAKKNIHSKREYVDFNDQLNISDYAIDSVKELYSAEIISGMGDGFFGGKAPVTRAQAAKVIYNAFCR